MYCVRVSLRTVKIFLAQHCEEKGFVGNLYISLIETYLWFALWPLRLCLLRELLPLYLVQSVPSLP
jgi:hypothetical protein